MPSSKNRVQTTANRKYYRHRRQRLHPERETRSERLMTQTRFLEETLEQLAAASETLQAMRSENEKAKAQVARTLTDMDSLRKRTARDKEDTKKFAARQLIEALLPSLDAFEQALAALQMGHDTETLAQGVQAINQLLHKALNDQGLQTLTPLGQPFDPQYHEALGMDATDEYPPNAVSMVLQSGYVLNGQLVRPARDRIAQAASKNVN
ncbi:MAG TPA: nucleotide exchange factor GrpE [Candidatus Sumerlaeota bacterium]|nr:nucleotide exchange factor GrpE [Candidatus Sumerlaeota bacterium]